MKMLSRSFNFIAKSSCKHTRIRCIRDRLEVKKENYFANNNTYRIIFGEADFRHGIMIGNFVQFSRTITIFNVIQSIIIKLCAA